MNSFDCASRDEAWRILPQRACGTRPLRRSSPLIDACEAMKRWASSPSDISSENSATALSDVSAAFSAKLAMSADFPIAGLAARMIRLPGWKPPVMLSRSSKPDGRAGDRRALERELLELVELGVQQLLDRAEVLARVLVGDLEDDPLGHVHEVARERLVAVDLGLDLVGGVQEPPEHRVVAHDPRVLADVADGGDGAGEQLDRRRAADGSSSPACLRCSTSVSASIGSPWVCRSSIAW